MIELDSLIDYKQKHNIWGASPLIAVCGWNASVNDKVADILSQCLATHSLNMPTTVIESQWSQPYTSIGRLTLTKDFAQQNNSLVHWMHAHVVASRYLNQINTSDRLVYIVPNAPNPQYEMDYKARVGLLSNLNISPNDYDKYEEILNSGIVLGEIIPPQFALSAFGSGIMQMLTPLVTVVVDMDVLEIDTYDTVSLKGTFMAAYCQQLAHHWRVYAALSHSKVLAEELSTIPIVASKPLTSFSINKKSSVVYLNLQSKSNIRDTIAQAAKEVVEKLPRLTGLALLNMINHAQAMFQENDKEEVKTTLN